MRLVNAVFRFVNRATNSDAPRSSESEEPEGDRECTSLYKAFNLQFIM